MKRRCSSCSGNGPDEDRSQRDGPRRYFLGGALPADGHPEGAPTVRPAAPSTGLGRRSPLAWIVEAEALLQCGSASEARSAADRALDLAASAEQRERIRGRFAELWPGPDRE